MKHRLLKGLLAILVALFLIPAGELLGVDLRIVSYNVRNYNLINRRIDDRWRMEYPKPEHEKHALRQVLHLIDADVVAFQEIATDISFLKELQRDLRREGLDYPFVIHMRGPDNDRALGLLSKVEPANVTRHREIAYTLDGDEQLVRRGMLEVSFRNTSGSEWRIFNIHLKSRISDDPGDPDAKKQRSGEARAVRNLIQTRCGSDGLYLVLGDLNDTPNSSAMKRLLKKGDATLAIDTHPMDTRLETWTYFHALSETYERIDIMLISPDLSQALAGWTSSIFDHPIWKNASDHRPVILDLTFPESAQEME